MRMRKKRHGEERLARCAEFLLTDPAALFGDPASPFYGREGEIHLEIGCGKGAFAVESAARHPERRYLAVEKVENVMINALERAEAARESCVGNLRFLIAHAEDLENWLPPRSVSAIYLNFSDPWPKKGHVRRRLTAPERVEQYKRLLAPGGRIIQKTDNDELFAFSLGTLEEAGFETEFVTSDLHASSRAEENVMTEYERAFSEQGKQINCLICRLPD
ncbi:MAG: tRNA (guanosine(46)-N7)-methyltransferase TrmB [Clostridia bacterium]|nr:tRNA (guanosine(46)-N7)-methyltransferase TrmB [Clostridia bacterium]